MSWSNEAVIQFLKLYKREQVLWDPKHVCHKNRSEISNAWERIQADFDLECSIVDLKKKKESLMTSFRLHYSRKKADENYKTAWFAYDLMESFLNEKYESNNLENEMSCNTQSSNKHGKSASFRNKNNTHNTTNCLKIQPSKLKIESQNTSVITNDTVCSNNAASIEDEYELYGQLLAKKLRKLDERQRDIVMHEIDNIMFRAKMKSGCSQSTDYSSSSPSTKPKSPLFIVSPLSQSNYEDENIQNCDVFPRESKINPL